MRKHMQPHIVTRNHHATILQSLSPLYLLSHTLSNSPFISLNKIKRSKNSVIIFFFWKKRKKINVSDSIR